MSLFHFMRRTLPRSMSRDVLSLITDGKTTVNGEKGDMQRPVRTGDFVIVDTTACVKRKDREPPETMNVLYRDRALICVDKPAGIPVIPDRRPNTPTAVELCARMLEQEGIRPKPVHRLDKHTSGVLILALRKEFVTPLGELFSERRIQKIYHAFVRGTPRPPEGMIDAPIAPNQRKMGRMLVNRSKGKQARSGYRTLEVWNGYAMVEVTPETGRTHQVRVHMAHIKNPILCDTLYGGGEAFHLSTIKPDYRIGRGKRERPILNRQALHAAQLNFISPATEKEVEVRAPLPEDLVLLKSKLEKFA
jgi:23S rRNA pseudouridine1911/1915/1917 synthase